MQGLVLRNGELHAEVLPAVGGALARLDALTPAGALPVLRPFTFTGTLPRPNQLACFALLPWSNRMAGGFSWGGRRYGIAPNREGDAWPIHGEGWLLPWQVERHTDTHLALRLEQARAAPFSYMATLDYVLDGPRLEVRIAVRNMGLDALPFGLGLHPFMPRGAGTTLHAPAGQVWLNGANRLPSHAVPVPEDWRFEPACRLPATLIDHAFAGWDGVADIAWPERGLRLRIESDARCYIVYAPLKGDFFCFEPVDHLINAHNLPGGPERNGLTVLAPGECLTRQFSFIVDTAAAWAR
jgi:aldose 1-epimerase